MDDFMTFLIATEDDDDNDSYYESVNNFWLDVQVNDSISDKNKDEIRKLCEELLKEKWKFKRDAIIEKIQKLMK